MELELLTQYINLELKNRLKFKERYYLDSNSENNTITIKTIFPLVDNNLFEQITNDQITAMSFIENILNLVKSYDSNVKDIKLSINICDNKYVGFTITKIRDATLINMLEILPDEIISYIASFLHIEYIGNIRFSTTHSTLKNFLTTCQKYYNMIHNPNFWLIKCSNNFSLGIQDIKNVINDNSFINYKKLLMVYFSDNGLSDREYLLILVKLNLLSKYFLRELIKNIYENIQNIQGIGALNITYIDDITINMLELIINKYAKTKLFRKYEKELMPMILKYLKRENLLNLL